MDINCTNQCSYQYEGKCTLNDLQGISVINKLATDSDIDCPYCQI